MKCITSLLVTSVPLLAIGQQPFPTVADNPEWSVSLGIMGTDYGTYVLSYDGTTTLCGYEYSVVPLDGVGMYGPGYVRNEGSRVLFRTSTDCFEPERVMYDYSASIGDTLEIGVSDVDGYIDHFIVDTIESISTLAGERRRFKLFHQGPFAEPTDPFFIPMYWIEGVGSTRHPFFSLACLWDGCETFWGLYCVDSVGVPVYRSWPGATCHQNIGIGERSDANELLSATMSSDGSLQLAFPTSFERGVIRVMDASGRQLSAHRISQDQKTMSPPSVAAGTYHLVLSDIDGRTWSTRWLSAH